MQGFGAALRNGVHTHMNNPCSTKQSIQICACLGMLKCLSLKVKNSNVWYFVKYFQFQSSVALIPDWFEMAILGLFLLVLFPVLHLWVKFCILQMENATTGTWCPFSSYVHDNWFLWSFVRPKVSLDCTGIWSFLQKPAEAIFNKRPLLGSAVEVATTMTSTATNNGWGVMGTMYSSNASDEYLPPNSTQNKLSNYL